SISKAAKCADWAAASQRDDACGRRETARGYFITWRCLARRRALSDEGVAEALPAGAVAASSDATGSAATVKANPYPVSLAKTPETALIGTDTSCEAPLKRAVNWMRSLSMVSRRVAPALMLSTISPFFTNDGGTRVFRSTLTARYGVRPLSAHHSQMARTR